LLRHGGTTWLYKPKGDPTTAAGTQKAAQNLPTRKATKGKKRDAKIHSKQGVRRQRQQYSKKDSPMATPKTPAPKEGNQSMLTAQATPATAETTPEHQKEVEREGPTEAKRQLFGTTSKQTTSFFLEPK
jgi:hypothetical protein